MYLKMILTKDPSPECAWHFIRLHFLTTVQVSSVPKQRKPEFSCLSSCFLCFPLGILFTQLQMCVCTYVQSASATQFGKPPSSVCVVFQWPFQPIRAGQKSSRFWTFPLLPQGRSLLFQRSGKQLCVPPWEWEQKPSQICFFRVLYMCQMMEYGDIFLLLSVSL